MYSRNSKIHGTDYNRKVGKEQTHCIGAEHFQRGLFAYIDVTLEYAYNRTKPELTISTLLIISNLIRGGRRHLRFPHRRLLLETLSLVKLRADAVDLLGKL